MRPQYEMTRWSTGMSECAGSGAMVVTAPDRAERAEQPERAEPPERSEPLEWSDRLGRERAVLDEGAVWLRHRHEHYFRVLDEGGETVDEALAAEIVERLGRVDAMVASLGTALRRPLVVAQAICRAMASPEIYFELVVDSGWSVEAFESWLAASLADELL
jgi:hypothetical protein